MKVLSMMLLILSICSVISIKPKRTLRDRISRALEHFKDRESLVDYALKLNTLKMRIRRICAFEFNISDCISKGIYAISETLKVNQYPSYEEMMKATEKECENGSETTKKECKDQFEKKGTAAKNLQGFVLERIEGKLAYIEAFKPIPPMSYPLYQDVVKYALGNNFVNFPKPEMDTIKEGLLNFFGKLSSLGHVDKVDIKGADSISPEFTKLFTNLNLFMKPRFIYELLFVNQEINSLDKLYSYIGHQLYSRLKSFNQEVMESNIHLDEEKIIEQLKKPNPNESLFKDDSTLKPIFEQMEETLSIKFIL